MGGWGWYFCIQQVAGNMTAAGPVPRDGLSSLQGAIDGSARRVVRPSSRRPLCGECIWERRGDAFSGLRAVTIGGSVRRRLSPFQHARTATLSLHPGKCQHMLTEFATKTQLRIISNAWKLISYTKINKYIKMNMFLDSFKLRLPLILKNQLLQNYIFHWKQIISTILMLNKSFVYLTTLTERHMNYRFN